MPREFALAKVVQLLLLYGLGLTSAANSAGYLPKVHEDCDKWAQKENQCMNNPTFMWSSCLASCWAYATDDDSRCALWASQGECSNNPKYIQLHCPKSCELTLGWNPWARKQLKIGPAPISEREIEDARIEPCSGLAVDAYGAAQVGVMS
jgi:hypothetical protein